MQNEQLQEKFVSLESQKGMKRLNNKTYLTKKKEIELADTRQVLIADKLRLEQEIEDYRGKIEGLRSEMHSAALDHQSQFLKLHAEHKSESDKLSQQYQLEKDSIEKKHHEYLESIESEYKIKLQALQSENDSLKEELVERFESQMRQLENELAMAKEELSESKVKISNLQEELETTQVTNKALRVSLLYIYIYICIYIYEV